MLSRFPNSLNTLTVATTMARGALQAQFAQANPTYPAGSIVLGCTGKSLSQAQVCLDKNMHPQACQGLQSACPTTISITPP